MCLAHVTSRSHNKRTTYTFLRNKFISCRGKTRLLAHTRDKSPNYIVYKAAPIRRRGLVQSFTSRTGSGLALLLLPELFVLTLASVFQHFYWLNNLSLSTERTLMCSVSFFCFHSLNNSNLLRSGSTNCRCFSFDHPFAILAYFRVWDNIIRWWHASGLMARIRTAHFCPINAQTVKCHSATVQCPKP